MMQEIFEQFADSQGRMGFQGVRDFIQALQDADSDTDDGEPLGEMPEEDWEIMCDEFGVDPEAGMTRQEFERLLEEIRTADDADRR